MALAGSALPKRFYKDVTALETDGVFRILLDGRVMKTMARNILTLPNAQIVKMVAEEWAAQTTHVDPNTMPMTRLANITLDRIPAERAVILNDLMLYAETDLLCHRAPEPELAAMQDEHWNPILLYLEENHNIIMRTTTGVVPREQPAPSLALIRELFEATNHEIFAGLAMLVPLTGSILMPLALWKKALALDKALIACRLDEEYQAARWGKDVDTDALWQTKAQDLQACVRWLHSVAN